MCDRLFKSFLWALLLVLPLQGIAAANLMVCNSIMQLQPSTGQDSVLSTPQSLPCHGHIQPTGVESKRNMSHDHGKTHAAPCKNACTAMCSMTALPPQSAALQFPDNVAPMIVSDVSYVSVTLPNLQRPPIFLS